MRLEKKKREKKSMITGRNDLTITDRHPDIFSHFPQNEKVHNPGEMLSLLL